MRRHFVNFPVFASSTHVIANKIQNGIECFFPNNVRYEIITGNTICIYSDKTTAPELEALPLYGFIIAALLHQNQLLVLHGSTLELGGKGIVIVGNKMFGKSTLVAGLLARGHKLISDDVTVVSDDQGDFIALPGAPILKLWPSAISTTGVQFHYITKLFEETEKRMCFLRQTDFQNDPLRIAAIIILRGKSNQATFHKIKNAQEKMLSLAPHNYFSDFPHLFNNEQKYAAFQKMCGLVNKAEFYIHSRPYDLNELEKSIDIIEKKICR